MLPLARSLTHPILRLQGMGLWNCVSVNVPHAAVPLSLGSGEACMLLTVFLCQMASVLRLTYRPLHRQRGSSRSAC